MKPKIRVLGWKHSKRPGGNSVIARKRTVNDWEHAMVLKDKWTALGLEVHCLRHFPVDKS
jgi:hypothetical protein